MNYGNNLPLVSLTSFTFDANQIQQRLIDAPTQVRYFLLLSSVSGHHTFEHQYFPKPVLEFVL